MLGVAEGALHSAAKLDVCVRERSAQIGFERHTTTLWGMYSAGGTLLLFTSYSIPIQALVL